MPTPKSAPLAKPKKKAAKPKRKIAAPPAARAGDSIDDDRRRGVAQHQADNPRAVRKETPTTREFTVTLQNRHADYVEKCAAAWSTPNRKIGTDEAIQIMVRQYRQGDENRAIIEGRGGATGRAGTFNPVEGKFNR